MSSTYGKNLKLSIFGQSHGRAIGMTLDGIPAGLPVAMDALQAFLDRRAPGGPLTTARREADVPEFLSGIIDSHTCGAPIAAIISNTDVRPGDYSEFTDKPRPGHADYTAAVKYRGFQDGSGGGHFSGRLTAPLCIAGGLCKQWLALEGIAVDASLLSVGSASDPALFQAEIENARADGDSIGGIIQCIATGIPAGIGAPIFGGMENRIAQMIFGIPGIRGLEFGSGFAGSRMRGSQHNDAFYYEADTVRTRTNHCGGILGGITDGMPLVFRVAVKPTPSIPQAQETVSLSKKEKAVICVTGRHDPCIALRAVPVVEAAAAIAIFDAILGG